MVDSSYNPLVSVGIPTYNRPEGLRRTLECITGQTYKNLEIIISDNRSPGLETEAVVKEFIANDSRIQYYKQEENKGAGFNFEFVLEKATGEYFMWAADDDEWDKKFIKQCVTAFELEPEAVLSYSEPYLLDWNGWKLFSQETELTTTGFAPVSAARKILFSSNPFTVIYGLIRTPVIKNISLKDRYGYDQTVILYLGVTGRFVKVDKGLFFYGTHGVSESSEDMIQQLDLQKNTRYFSQIYMAQDMLKAIFTFKSKLTFTEKILIGFLIIFRNIFVKQRFLSIVFGFRLYCSHKLKEIKKSKAEKFFKK